jgi:hypothetical protein
VGVEVAVGVGGSGPAVGVPPPAHAATNTTNSTMAGPSNERRAIFIRTQPFYQQTFKQRKSRQVYNDDWELWQ